MSKERIILLLAFLLLAGGVAWSMLASGGENWTPVYSRQFDSPFGTQFLYDLLQDDASHELREIPAPLADYPRIGLETDGDTWILINGIYSPDQHELKLLQERVDAGMNAFIAAQPGSGLSKWLGVKSRDFEGQNLLRDYLREISQATVDLDFPAIRGDALPAFQTEASFLTSWLEPEAAGIDEESVTNSEGNDDSQPQPQPQLTILAEHDGKPIFVRIEREGAGTVWLLTSPLLLTNYHIWKPEFEATTAAIISHLPDTPLLWDEYYKPLGPIQGNPLSVMLANPALSAAWFSMLALMLLFLLFRVKRTQRAVPVIEPPKNATLNHLERVSTLFQQKDRELRVLDERIRYLAFVLDIEEPTTDEAIIKRLSEKHRLPAGGLDRVMRAYGRPAGSKKDLKELNDQIDKLLTILRPA
jgi:hypothetical protein